MDPGSFVAFRQHADKRVIDSLADAEAVAGIALGNTIHHGAGICVAPSRSRHVLFVDIESVSKIVGRPHTVQVKRVGLGAVSNHILSKTDSVAALVDYRHVSEHDGISQDLYPVAAIARRAIDLDSFHNGSLRGRRECQRVSLQTCGLQDAAASCNRSSQPRGPFTNELELLHGRDRGGDQIRATRKDKGAAARRKSSQGGIDRGRIVSGAVPLGAIDFNVDPTFGDDGGRAGRLCRHQSRQQ